MEFNQLLKQIDVILTDRQLEQFKIYFEFLVEYNNYVNLTCDFSFFFLKRKTFLSPI